MGKWEMVRLGDVCDFINGDRGKNYPSSKDFCESGIPFINAGHLENDIVSFDNMNYISEQKYNSLGAGKVQRGDLLYCLRGSLGKLALIEDIEKGAIASSLVILRPQKIDKNFLRYSMKTPFILEQQLKANNGSSQPNLSAASVKNYSIPLPPLATQQKIADILDRASALIEKRKAQIEKLDLLVKSQFVEMFGDPVTNPMDFPLVKIGDFTTKIRSGLSRKLAADDIGIPVIRSTNMINGYLDTTDIKYWYIKDPQGANTSDYILEDGDILVNFINSNEHIGKVCLFKDMGRDCIYTTNIFVVKVDNSCSNIWFSNFAKTSAYKAKLSRIIQPAVNQSSFTTARFREIEIPLPPFALQTQFAAFVECVEAQKAQLKKSLTLLELNYKSLMQKCFIGEVF